MRTPIVLIMTAPDFNDSYPSSGAKIGPAWQAAWDALADGRELTSVDLVAVMVAAAEIAEKTAYNLLSAARRSGRLRLVSYVPAPGANRRGKVSMYRRVD